MSSRQKEVIILHEIEQSLPDTEEELILDEVYNLLEIGTMSAHELDEQVEEEPESRTLRYFTNADSRGTVADDIVGLYFHEMAQEPLLSHKEEIELARRIELGRKAKQAMTAEEVNLYEQRELKKLIRDAEEADTRFIRANTRLVVSIAKKYANQGVPFLDLIQEGNLGLMKAVERFDYRHGHRFSTYATWWIRQAITQALGDQGYTIRIPIHMNNRIRKLRQTAQQMKKRLGRPPTEEELATEVEIAPQQVRWMLHRPQQPLSLEEPLDEEEDTELGHVIEDDRLPTPTDAAARMMLTEEVNKVLATLDPREETILRLRYGFWDGETHTLEEIGEHFGLSRERIRQIEGRALRKLRHPLRSHTLREYY